MIRLGCFVYGYFSERTLTTDHCSKDTNIQAAKDIIDFSNPLVPGCFRQLRYGTLHVKCMRVEIWGIIDKIIVWLS